MIKVFISHSSQDTELAGLLVDLLRSALNLRAEDIRASSVDGYRLPAGAKTDDQLREELLAAPAFIGILSPLSLSSAYVLFELGARWGARNRLIPLLAPGTNAHALKGPIANLNALSCGSTSQLHQLVNEVGSAIAVKPENPAVYEMKIEAVAYHGVVGGSPSIMKTAVDLYGPGGVTASSRTDSGTLPQDAYSEADAVMRRHCEADWPTDFSMQAYCIEQQRKAVAELRRGAPEGVPQQVFDQIRRHCAAEWPYDYAMRAYCEGQQVAGYHQVSDH